LMSSPAPIVPDIAIPRASQFLALYCSVTIINTCNVVSEKFPI
jgi:hypothetical protein